MFLYIKSIFSKSSKNLLAVIDVWSFLVKVLIIDIKSWNIVSSGEALQHSYAMKSWSFNDLKSVIKTINEALNMAENKIWESVTYVVFWISAEVDNFYQKTFRWYVQTISDEIWWSFLWFFYLPSIYYQSITSKLNYLLIDIWANTTSIALVKDWIFKASEAFPFWSAIFTNRISKIFSISKRDAEKVKILLSSWSENDSFHLTPEDFRQDIQLWLTAFWVSLKNFWEQLPRFIYLTWAWSLFPFLKDALKNRDFPFKKLWFEDVPEFDFLTDVWVKLNRGKKLDNVVPWIPVSMLAEFALKNLVKDKVK